LRPDDAPELVSVNHLDADLAQLVAHRVGRVKLARYLCGEAAR